MTIRNMKTAIALLLLVVLVPAQAQCPPVFPDFSCEVCGAGKCVGNFNGIVTGDIFSSPITCKTLEGAALNGHLPSTVSCESLYSLVGACGCTETGPPSVPTVAPPTAAPTVAPPTVAPIVASPTAAAPTVAAPTVAPTVASPTVAPTVAAPTGVPTVARTILPTIPPTIASTDSPFHSLGCPEVSLAGCSICGTGLCVQNKDVLVSLPELGDLTCSNFEIALRFGVFTDDECESLRSLAEPCGCGTPKAGDPAPVASPAPAPIVEQAAGACPQLSENGCSACGKGKCVQNPDVLFSFPGWNSIPCIDIEREAAAGRLEFFCSFPTFEENCECGVPGAPTSSQLVPTQAPLQPAFAPSALIVAPTEATQSPSQQPSSTEGVNLSSAVDRSAQWSLWIAHGFFAALAWGFFAPIAIGTFLLRDSVLIGSGTWPKIHFYSTLMVASMTLVSFFLAVVAYQQGTPYGEKPNHFSGLLHRTLGLGIFVACVVQVIVGTCEPEAPKKAGNRSTNNKTAIRAVWESAYTSLGFILLSSGLYQCTEGFRLYSLTFSSPNLSGVFWIFVVVLLGLMILLFLWHQWTRHHQETFETYWLSRDIDIADNNVQPKLRPKKKRKEMRGLIGPLQSQEQQDIRDEEDQWSDSQRPPLNSIGGESVPENGSAPDSPATAPDSPSTSPDSPSADKDSHTSDKPAPAFPASYVDM